MSAVFVCPFLLDYIVSYYRALYNCELNERLLEIR